jgi:hypothetical protein
VASRPSASSPRANASVEKSCRPGVTTSRPPCQLTRYWAPPVDVSWIGVQTPRKRANLDITVRSWCISFERRHPRDARPPTGGLRCER